MFPSAYRKTQKDFIISSSITNTRKSSKRRHKTQRTKYVHCFHNTILPIKPNARPSSKTTYVKS